MYPSQRPGTNVPTTSLGSETKIGSRASSGRSPLLAFGVGLRLTGEDLNGDRAGRLFQRLTDVSGRQVVGELVVEVSPLPDSQATVEIAIVMRRPMSALRRPTMLRSSVSPAGTSKRRPRVPFACHQDPEVAEPARMQQRFGVGGLGVARPGHNGPGLKDGAIVFEPQEPGLFPVRVRASRGDQARERTGDLGRGR